MAGHCCCYLARRGREGGLDRLFLFEFIGKIGGRRGETHLFSTRGREMASLVADRNSNGFFFLFFLGDGGISSVSFYRRDKTLLVDYMTGRVLRRGRTRERSLHTRLRISFPRQCWLPVCWHTCVLHVYTRRLLGRLGGSTTTWILAMGSSVA